MCVCIPPRPGRVALACWPASVWVATVVLTVAATLVAAVGAVVVIIAIVIVLVEVMFYAFSSDCTKKQGRVQSHNKN